MSNEKLFKAKRTDNGRWEKGFFVKLFTSTGKRYYIYTGVIDATGLYPVEDRYEVDPETLCQYTGLTDKNGKKIWKNDICKLVLPNGEVRYFKVSIKSVVRKVVSHPDFDDATAKVEITGVVFEWNGYELFPCTDTYGVADYKMMEVVGNVFDNPELLE